MGTENMRAAVIILLLLILSVSWLAAPNPMTVYPAKSPVGNEKGAGKIIIVYSPTCPHCENLLAYLEKHYPDAPITKSTDPQIVRPYLEEANVVWQGGVPIMVVVTDNNVYIISGFPSKYQDKNGYINGRAWEMSWCRGIHGKMYPSERNYFFCIRPDGTIIGNEHAVDWVMEQLGIKRVQ